MLKKEIGIVSALAAYSALSVYYLPYAIWSLPLTLNFLFENEYILYRDIVYHHPPFPPALLYWMSIVLGNTEHMLRSVSFLLGTLFLVLVYWQANRSKLSLRFTLALTFITFLPTANNFNIEEMLATVFILLGSISYFLFHRRKSGLFGIVAGLFVGLAFLSKQISILILLPFYIHSWYMTLDKHPKAVIRIFLQSSMYIWTGLVAALAPPTLYYILHGAGDDFMYWNILYNIFEYPGLYRKSIIPSFSYEIWAALMWVVQALVVGVYLFFKGKLTHSKKGILLFFIASTVVLSPALLPGMHLYKFLMIYPFALLLQVAIVSFAKRLQRFIYACLFIVASFIPIYTFYKGYFIPIFPSSEFIYEYGSEEVELMHWLSSHISTETSVMNLGHHYITTKAQILPHNKYIISFPWLLEPFDKTSKEILHSPPDIVIIDTKQIDQFPVLENWPFLIHVFDSYKIQEKIGSYEIWKR